VFNGGFSEGGPLVVQDEVSISDTTSEAGEYGSRIDDSDEEDEFQGDTHDSDEGAELMTPSDHIGHLPRPTSTSANDFNELIPVDQPGTAGLEEGNESLPEKLSDPTSPRSSSHIPPPTIFEARREASRVGPQKMRVVVKDVAYSTYRAVLYYVSPKLVREYLMASHSLDPAPH